MFFFGYPAFALDGIWHNPYGIDDLYDHEPTEIYPLTPIAGEMIYIKSTTWPVEAGQSVWLTYTKNGGAPTGYRRRMEVQQRKQQLLGGCYWSF